MSEAVPLATFIIIVFDSIGTTVPNHVHDIHTDTFAHQSVAAFGVHYCTLFIHHVVIFQQAFTDAEVVFFHTFLCLFDGVRHHFVFNRLAFLQAEAVEPLHYRVGGEQTHQLVFERHKED